MAKLEVAGTEFRSINSIEMFEGMIALTAEKGVSTSVERIEKKTWDLRGRQPVARWLRRTAVV